MVKELLEIILQVISSYNTQVGLYTINCTSRPTYVFLFSTYTNHMQRSLVFFKDYFLFFQLIGLIAQILNNSMGMLLLNCSTCITNKLMKMSNFDIKCPIQNNCELKLCYL